MKQSDIQIGAKVNMIYASPAPSVGTITNIFPTLNSFQISLDGVQVPLVFDMSYARYLDLVASPPTAPAIPPAVVIAISQQVGEIQAWLYKFLNTIPLPVKANASDEECPCGIGLRRSQCEYHR